GGKFVVRPVLGPNPHGRRAQVRIPRQGRQVSNRAEVRYGLAVLGRARLRRPSGRREKRIHQCGGQVHDRKTLRGGGEFFRRVGFFQGGGQARVSRQSGESGHRPAL